MKSLVFKTITIGFAISLFSLFFVNNVYSTNLYQSETVTVDLTQEEIKGMFLIREEEKLAHEVYAHLYKKWELPIFNNNSKSKSKRTPSIKVLLSEFDLDDSYNKSIGVYSNLELQGLYFDLIQQGSRSVEEALKVGATIEDLFIADLNKYTAKTNNKRILKVYDNLNRKSKNHLRSFVRQLAMKGQIYKPKYISQNDFDLIIASDNNRNGNKKGKKGKGKGNGQGKGQGRGRGMM